MLDDPRCPSLASTSNRHKLEKARKYTPERGAKTHVVRPYYVLAGVKHWWVDRREMTMELAAPCVFLLPLREHAVESPSPSSLAFGQGISHAPPDLAIPDGILTSTEVGRLSMFCILALTQSRPLWARCLGKSLWRVGDKELGNSGGSWKDDSTREPAIDNINKIGHNRRAHSSGALRPRGVKSGGHRACTCYEDRDSEAERAGSEGRGSEYPVCAVSYRFDGFRVRRMTPCTSPGPLQNLTLSMPVIRATTHLRAPMPVRSPLLLNIRRIV